MVLTLANDFVLMPQLPRLRHRHYSLRVVEELPWVIFSLELLQSSQILSIIQSLRRGTVQFRVGIIRICTPVRSCEWSPGCFGPVTHERVVHGQCSVIELDDELLVTMGVGSSVV